MAGRHLKRTSLSRVSTHWFTPAKALLGLTFLLTCLGLFFVFDSSVAEAFAMVGDQYHFARLQAGYLIMGWVVLFIGFKIPLSFWKKVSPLLYGLGIILLIMVFLPWFGREINGAHRWLFIGPLRGQPIEFMKFAVVTFFASWLIKHQRFLPFLILVS